MVLLLTQLTLTAGLSVLVLVALLLLFSLVKRRLSDAGDALADLGREMKSDVDHLRESIAGLTGSVASLRETVEQLPPPSPPPAALPVVAPPEVDLSGVEKRLDSLAASIAELTLRQSAAGDVAAPTVDLRRLIEDRFRSQGFESIRLLDSDGIDALTTGEGRVRVEGARKGLTSKGYVVLAEGAIVDEKMTSSHDAFP